jgi:hypothetical protein
MCEDCNPIESNTGVIQYSGPNLVICNGNTITNGELLTSVIAKIDNCIGALQNQLDFTGLVENSPCINLTKTSLQTVLQSILDTESAYCTQLQNLNTQLTNLQNQINSLILTKPVTVTACDPSRVTFTPGTAVNTFKLNGLVPPKTILPYFGPATDFSPTGLGLPNTVMAGWAIANGNNGTINALNQFIKYGPSATTTPSGSNTVTLNVVNIPPLTFNVNANFNLSGTTDEAGEHRHISRNLEFGSPGCVINADDGDLPEANPNIYIEAQPNSGCATASFIGKNGIHSHTFNAEATGSFTGNTINDDVQEINVQPLHIQAIPIQWVGCV